MNGTYVDSLMSVYVFTEIAASNYIREDFENPCFSSPSLRLDQVFRDKATVALQMGKMPSVL